MRSHFALVLCVWFVAQPATTPAAEPKAPLKVLFWDAFWPGNAWSAAFVRLMREAASELGVKLEVVRAPRWPTQAFAAFEAQLEGQARPDYVIFTIAPGYKDTLLQIAERARVPVFLVNAGLLPEDREKAGKPREHFKFWVGQMLPNDEQAGYELAIALIDQAHQQGRVDAAGKVQLVALSGTQIDYPSTQREHGLHRALRERKDAQLNQLVWVDWRRDEAKRKLPLLLRRFPRTTAVWTAADTVARGAVEALESMGRVPGKDILVGGVDWEPWALQAVEQGKLVTTVGGHVLEGAWALVLLYDLHHGRDFAPECLDVLTPMLPVTRANARRYEALMQPGAPWRGEQFSALSRTLNPERRDCHLTVEDVLGRLQVPSGSKEVSSP